MRTPSHTTAGGIKLWDTDQLELRWHPHHGYSLSNTVATWHLTNEQAYDLGKAIEWGRELQVTTDQNTTRAMEAHWEEPR